MERIQDYAIIGDCRSAALVSRFGSIDWLCWPRFDSPPIFGALLDPKAGNWSLTPTEPASVQRRYVDGTNVLQTLFETCSGTLLLTDLMPIASEARKRESFVADHQILRQLECLDGEVEVELVFEPRLDFGRRPLRIRSAGSLGLRFEDGGARLLVLQSDLELGEPSGDQMRARIRLRAGEARFLSLIFCDDWPGTLPPIGPHSRELLARSLDWWRQWTAQLTYEGPCREAVVRSALLLKLLVYAPSGAIVAAPTTSLPERLGGDLNWDYRFCWLRDASLTMRALFGLGFAVEAEAFLSWLLHSTRLTRPELRILYDVFGNKPPREVSIPGLAGYRDSRPVRIGNAASDQLQLDVYGEVIDAAAQYSHHGGTFDRDTQRMLSDFGEQVCRHWDQPDEGIWEPRSGRAHHTHSRLLCWTALDRLLYLNSKGQARGIPAERFEHNRALLRAEIEQRAWNPKLGSYVARLDGTDELDASLLLLSWYGFEPPTTERMRGTWARIRERLGTPNGLLYRYRSPESAGEGAFGICSFWGAEHLALGGGTAEEAQAALEHLVALGNDVGLFAEESDPATGDALGNFPQAFTHVGLINAALSLSSRLRAREPVARSIPADRARTETGP